MFKISTITHRLLAIVAKCHEVALHVEVAAARKKAQAAYDYANVAHDAILAQQRHAAVARAFAQDKSDEYTSVEAEAFRVVNAMNNLVAKNV